MPKAHMIESLVEELRGLLPDNSFLINIDLGGYHVRKVLYVIHNLDSKPNVVYEADIIASGPTLKESLINAIEVLCNERV